MARMRSRFGDRAPREAADTVIAPLVDSGVDIAVYPQRWAVQPRTPEHQAAVHRHGKAADRLLVRAASFAFCAWLLHALLAWLRA